MTNASSENRAAVFETDLRLPDRRQGKVRDIYRIPVEGDVDRLLIVASDRISAFDVVLPGGLPSKGRLLTGISTHWLRWIEKEGLAKTHLISVDPADLPSEALGGTPIEDLEGRITIGHLCEVIPVEAIVRGYLEGSGWRDYQKTGQVCGIDLPEGLRQCDQLPEPLFTPSTKAEQGLHDENITPARAAEIIGQDVYDEIERTSLAIYRAASAYARERGIIIADTKFEFGFPLDASGEPIRDRILLIDEALTPDSSRFWPADEYEPGHSQPSFDKQFVREYLQGLVDGGTWDKTPPGPELPSEVVEGTLSRYREAVDRLSK